MASLSDASFLLAILLSFLSICSEIHLTYDKDTTSPHRKWEMEWQTNERKRKTGRVWEKQKCGCEAGCGRSPVCTEAVGALQCWSLWSRTLTHLSFCNVSVCLCLPYTVTASADRYFWWTDCICSVTGAVGWGPSFLMELCILPD